MRGAALRGLEGIAPRIKHVRRHYGISLGMDFREGIDPEENAYYDFFRSTRKLCRSRMEWLISKVSSQRALEGYHTFVLLKANLLQGDEVVKGTSRTVDYRQEYSPGVETSSEMVLYSCSLADAPEYSTHPRMLFTRGKILWTNFQV